jgi:hypothetical protein
MEKIITSILAALSPILFSYIFKNIEKRNKLNVRKNDLDEAQKRLDFIQSYFNVQTGFGSNEQTEELKIQLYREAEQIKQKIDGIYHSNEELMPYGKLYTFQKVFLTFRPISFWGWLWHILFYLGLVFLSFLTLGYFMDESGNVVSGAFAKNIQDVDLVIGSLFFIGVVVGLNVLARRNFKAVSGS